MLHKNEHSLKYNQKYCFAFFFVTYIKAANQVLRFKAHQYIEDIQIFGMNMPFISSSEAKNAYFMSGEATNEIYIFSLHEMK